MTELVVFHINSYDDRRNLASILADNGYPTMIEDRQDSFIPTIHEFFVHVYENPKETEEKQI